MEQKSQKGPLVIIGILILIILGLGYFLYASKVTVAPVKNLSSATAFSTASVTVGNAISVASSALLNGGSSITLLPSPATTSVAVGATITDANGCNDISSVDIAVYKTGATCTSSGNANDDTCYFATVASSSLTGCSGGADTSSVLSHEFAFKSYADPGIWYTTITPVDVEATGTADTDSVALNETLALGVTPTLSYGATAGGATSTGDHTVTTTNLGNVAIDFTLEGVDLACNSGLNAQGTIPAGNEQYDLSSFSYGDGTALSNTTPASVDADLATTSSSAITNTTYWQVSVPSGVRGICSGAITFTAISAI